MRNILQEISGLECKLKQPHEAKVAGESDDAEAFLTGLRALGFQKGFDQMIQLAEKSSSEQDWFSGAPTKEEADEMGPKAVALREKLHE